MSDAVLLDIQDEIALLTLNRPERLNALNYDLIDRLMAALRSAFDELDRRLEPLECDQSVLAIAEALLALDPSARGRSLSTTCAIAVERTRQFLEENVERVVASEELEALTGLDRYALARHFRARLGTSPYRYLTMRRLDRARR